MREIGSVYFLKTNISPILSYFIFFTRVMQFVVFLSDLLKAPFSRFPSLSSQKLNTGKIQIIDHNVSAINI